MNVIREIKYIFYRYWGRLTYWCERKTKGYDRTATWALDDYLIRHNYEAIMAGIDAVKSHAREHDVTPDENMDTQQWINTLDRIEFAFWYRKLQDDREAYREYTDNLSNHEMLMLDVRAQQGFELFGKYFQSLWT